MTRTLALARTSALSRTPAAARVAAAARLSITANALSLNGTTAYAAATLPAALKVSPISIATWFKTATPATQMSLLALEPRNTNSAGLGLLLHTVSSHVGVQKGASATFVNANGVTAITANVWHLAVATYDGANILVYLDAVLDRTTASATGINYTEGGAGFPNPGQLYFGAYKTNVIGSGNAIPDSQFWSGLLYGIRIWSATLSQADITNLNNGVVNRTNLIGEWLFGGGGRTVADTSGTGTTLTLYGGATYAADVPAKAA